MIAIVTDSTAYLTREQAQGLGVQVVPLTYSAEGRVYTEQYADKSDVFEQMYRQYPDGFKTSQASAAVFGALFQKLLRQGYQVLCIVMSSRLSGNYNSACAAAREAGGPVRVIDSRTTAGGLAMLVERACILARSGMPLEKLAEELQQQIPRIGIVFSVETMEPLRRSGRLGVVRQSVGTILNIRPILLCDDGAVVAHSMVRGTAEQVAAMAARVPAGVKQLRLHYFGSPLRLDALKKRLMARFPGVELPVSPVGPVLGIHLGQGAFGVAWME